MESFDQCMEKLNTLLNHGHVTHEEYERRRKLLVDEYIGRPVAKPAAAMHLGVPASNGVRNLGSWGGKGQGRGFGLPQMGSYGMGMGMGAGMMGMGYGMGYGYGPMYGAGAGPRGPYGNAGNRFQPYPMGGKPKTSPTAIKIQPLPPTVSAEDLKYAFAVYGNAVTAVVKEGQVRHGYLNFATPEEATAACATGAVELAGQTCMVTLSWRYRPAVAEGVPTNGIGIFNLPFTMTYDEIVAMLQAYPGFLNVKMVTRKSGEFRGYVFAYFSTVEQAAYAKSSLLGMQIGDQVLDCKFSNKPAEEVLAAQ